ncbi:MAG: CPBP family intramembrane glutamic endopeptidase, partial [Pseudomonadota bacterium]
LFRGYLQQQLAARYKSRIIWMLAPSLIFGLVHFSPTFPLTTALYAVGAATAFGLIAADLTVQSGSIGPAWGMHFANNCFAALILAPRDTIEGLSLFLTPYSMADEVIAPATVIVHATVLIVTWWVIRRLIRR